MKKSILSLGALALLVVAVIFASQGFLSNEAMAEDAVNKGLVSVNGTGSITVKPDMGTITVGVETEDADASVAQAANKEKMDAVMAALEELGIAEDQIKTTQYSIYDRYNYFDDKDPVKYYSVTNSVQVTILDLDMVGQVIDAVTKAGANQVSNITFGISNEQEVYAEALKLAMASAKSKANAILGTFDKTASVPSKVVESGYSVGVMRDTFEMAMAKDSTPINPGTLTITANITAEYEY